MKKLNKKGGFTIVGLLLSFVALIIYVALLPTILAFIQIALNMPELDPMTAMVIQLFPLVLMVMIVVGTITSGDVRQEFGG